MADWNWHAEYVVPCAHLAASPRSGPRQTWLLCNACSQYIMRPILQLPLEILWLTQKREAQSLNEGAVQAVKKQNSTAASVVKLRGVEAG